MTLVQVSIYVGIMMFASITTRFLPFFFFPENKPLPNWVQFVADRLPYADIFSLLSSEQQADLTSALLSYGASISEPEIFTSETILV